MFKRKEIIDVAAQALQGLLANPKFADRAMSDEQHDMDDMVRFTVWYAIDVVTAVDKYISENAVDFEE